MSAEDVHLKRLAIVAVTLVLLAPAAFGTPWIQSIAAAQKKAKPGKKLIFVDLFADWCGWCHRMEQEVFPSEAFQKETDDMVLLRLNTEDGAEGTRLAQQYGVTSLPTFLVLNSDLKLAGTIRGYQPSKEFVDSIRGVESSYATFQKLSANEAAIANDYPQRLKLAQQFREQLSFSDAEVRFRKLMTDPKTPVDIRDRSYLELAVTQTGEGNFPEAIRTLNAFGKVQSKGDAYERSRIVLAQLYAQQGNMPASLNELKSFRAKFPHSEMIETVNALIAQMEHMQGPAK